MRWGVAAACICAAVVCTQAAPLLDRVVPTAPQYRSDVPNVHIISHTHDDVGWLKTVDEYYMGANNSIQWAGVQYILDSVLLALEANPERKFTYVEQAFFQRWYREQTPADQARVKAVVANGQLAFVNGGWCMHDEAATHYINMVSQTQLGHGFLKDEFGYTPSIGWQIDPFGHSATQAALLSAEAGFDALYFGRIDYQDHDLRMKERRMEFVWRASESLGVPAQVFTGAFQSGNYGPPAGFCFDQFCSDPPMQTDTRLEDYNVQSRVDQFIKDVNDYVNHSAPTNHISFKMGSDFQYANANLWYKNLDRLIAAVNADGRANVFYSNPLLYTKAVHDAGLTWTVKTDDFFPYADGATSVWAGYFTSRPTLKRYVREGSALLQAAQGVDVLVGGAGNATQQLFEALGVSAHHDAVSGTAKQHTSYDYMRRISEGTASTHAFLAGALGSLLANSGASPPLTFCNQLNMSVCAATQGMSGSGVAVVVWNAMARARTVRVTLPLPSASGTFAVQDASGAAVMAQVVDNARVPTNDDLTGTPAATSVAFQAKLPALGYATYFLAPASADDAAAAQVGTPAERRAQLRGERAVEVVSNGVLSLAYDTATGRITSVTNTAAGVTAAVQQEFLWWNSSASGNGWGNTNKQNSGAYIFRPNGTKAFPVTTGAPTLSIVRGAVVSTITQVWAPWLTSVTRLYAGADDFEMEWTVGVIPIDDALGKEVISRWTTNISSSATWYTDSNGRELQKRVRDFRPTWKLNVTEPVADNYFPVNAVIMMNDTTAAFSVAPDRSEGGSSLADGSLELMVHRRCLFDDGRGVGEPLNETQGITSYAAGPVHRIGHGLVVRGVHRIRLDASAGAAAGFRPLMDDVFANPVVAFSALGSTSPGDWAKAHRTTYSAVGTALPANVALMTLMPRPDGVLLRLSHQFAVGEDPTLSAPATVSLAALLPALGADNVTELSLTGNQPLADVQRMQWKTDDMGEAGVMPPTPPRLNRDVQLPDMDVTLDAMQIRTFLLTKADAPREARSSFL